MFTVVKFLNEYENAKRMVEATCISSDVKPTDYADNSICAELNTGTVYYLSEGEWHVYGGEN